MTAVTADGKRQMQIHTHQKCSKMVVFSCFTLDICIKAASSSFESQIKCLRFKRPAYEEHRDCRASLHSIFSTINERCRPGLWYVSAVIVHDHMKQTLSKVPPCCAPVSRHGCHGDAFSISGCLISACGCMWNGFMAGNIMYLKCFQQEMAARFITTFFRIEIWNCMAFHEATCDKRSGCFIWLWWSGVRLKVLWRFWHEY